MTYVNVNIETSQETWDYKHDHMLQAELVFWKKRAEDLQGRLENIFDHATKTGHVELWRNREKLDLYTAEKQVGK